MNHYKTNDWRATAHEEYENRKDLEAKLAQANLDIQALQQSLQTSNNYSNILNQKLNAVESTLAQEQQRLQRSVELLKNAKILYARRKHEIATLKNANQQLQHDISNIQAELLRKNAQLEAEMQQHERTNQKLAQALSKLAAATALSITGNTLLTDSEIIYAADLSNNFAQDTDEESLIQNEILDTKQPKTKQSIFTKLFASLDEHYEQMSEDLQEEQNNSENEFIEQLLNFEQQIKHRSN